MAHYQGYLSGFDIEDIQKRISSLFAEESEKIVLQDIKKLKEEVDMILQKVILAGNRAEDKYIARKTDLKENLMAEAYLIIFKLRQFLLEEEIDYRYYYTTSEGKAKAYSFSEKDILEFMHFEKNKLGISTTKITKMLEEQEYQKLLDKHFNNLIAGLQDVQSKDNKTLKVVHSYIMNKYGGLNPGLINAKTGKYQVFNMGHIYEAMDVAFTEAIQNNQIDNLNYIELLMYGKYLSYDSIEGIKGGDNAITMTQIKSNSAGFLKYHTIIEALKEISQILDKTLSIENLRERIEKLYVATVKYDDINACNEMIDNAVDKLVKEFNKI